MMINPSSLNMERLCLWQVCNCRFLSPGFTRSRRNRFFVCHFFGWDTSAISAFGDQWKMAISLLWTNHTLCHWHQDGKILWPGQILYIRDPRTDPIDFSASLCQHKLQAIVGHLPRCNVSFATVKSPATWDSSKPYCCEDLWRLRM